jgi:hypothetical protein
VYQAWKTGLLNGAYLTQKGGKGGDNYPIKRGDSKKAQEREYVRGLLGARRR